MFDFLRVLKDGQKCPLPGADHNEIMLKEMFTLHAARYSHDEGKIRSFWEEIERSYGNSRRHYHTLKHIAEIFDTLTPHSQKIYEWDVMVFAVFYHDVIYNVLRNNNEEQSATLAQKRMEMLGVPAQKIKRCRELILATKTHMPGVDADTNFLVDADLSILGKEWDMYWDYALEIRKEFSVFPDVLYNRGRTKVLVHFLQMDSIFKTSEFFNQYEGKARENLARELQYLKGRAGD